MNLFKRNRSIQAAESPAPSMGKQDVLIGREGPKLEKLSAIELRCLTMYIERTFLIGKMNWVVVNAPPMRLPAGHAIVYFLDESGMRGIFVVSPMEANRLEIAWEQQNGRVYRHETRPLYATVLLVEIPKRDTTFVLLPAEPSDPAPIQGGRTNSTAETT